MLSSASEPKIARLVGGTQSVSGQHSQAYILISSVPPHPDHTSLSAVGLCWDDICPLVTPWDITTAGQECSWPKSGKPGMPIHISKCIQQPHTNSRPKRHSPARGGVYTSPSMDTGHCTMSRGELCSSKGTKCSCVGQPAPQSFCPLP